MPAYNLLRCSPTPPYRRYACTVLADDAAPDGFRVVDADSDVVDAEFMYGLRAALRRPVKVMTGVTLDHETQESVDIRRPGDENYLAAAVRQVPGTLLGGIKL